MDFSTLITFRRGLYACFERAGDALMNTTDALLSETAAHSFAELSLSPCFERRWPSLYKAFQEAKIDRSALQRLFASQIEAPSSGKRLVLGGDASSIARPLSPTARDRTYVHASNLPEGAKPVTAGWQFSTLALLPEEPSSWTYILDNRRIPSQKTPCQVAAEQLGEVVALLPTRPLWVGDGSYGNVTFLLLTQGIACDKLMRLAHNRVLYRPAPPRTGKRGAPRKDGAPFKCAEVSTQGVPDVHFCAEDEKGQQVEVDGWCNLHFKQARHIPVSVFRVIRHAAKDTKRDPKVSWFMFEGEQTPPPADVPPTYGRRYSLEHGYRVDKQDLLWEDVRLRTPEQFQHWTDIVAATRNQLCLAREQAQAIRQPWEREGRPPTPQQVRRAMGRILAQLGTPACGCQPRGKSPGRLVGAVVKKAPRYKVVYKATDKPFKIV